MVNAFWLARDVDQAAAWLVDAHVTSSVFECSMVLTTAVQLNGYPREEELYITRGDHPLVRWAADAYGNWQYLRAYTEAAHGEWRYRWDHDGDESHACWDVVEPLDGDQNLQSGQYKPQEEQVWSLGIHIRPLDQLHGRTGSTTTRTSTLPSTQSPPTRSPANLPRVREAPGGAVRGCRVPVFRPRKFVAER